MSKVKKDKDSSEELSSSSCSTTTMSSDEEADAQDLKPIKGYLSNRRELATQLFKSVKPDKIRMMLPQALKRVNLDALEEWCASELSGMSKRRILCILNGKPMEESSDTSESNDSGPSLEIISDTEEWFTDDDGSKKEESLGSGLTKGRKSKVKVKSKLQKRGDADKCKSKAKINTKERADDRFKDVKVKTEKEPSKNKEKEGDSLLDLLELEMRARAIRALIRKEEDIIPSMEGSKAVKSNSGINKGGPSTAMQEDQKQKENCRRQLEKIISAHHVGNDDEDVVLVVQPTPTIELLTSDSESENHNTSRVNKRLQNERTSIETDTVDDKETKDSLQRDAKAPADTVIKEATKKRIECNNSQVADQPQSKHVEEKKRKSNKRSRTKDHSKPTKPAESSTLKSTKRDDKDGAGIAPSETNNTLDLIKVPRIEKEEPSQDTKNFAIKELKKSVTTEEEKSMDMDEIIDLDDYSDDMEDIEDFGRMKNKVRQIEEKDGKVLKEVVQPQKSSSTETWASRYYQTEDVQSVIKESKIQSEIRKRLRERQRLSKLNKSPSTTSPVSSSLTEPTPNTSTEKPTGSVDEYLALKRTLSINANSESDNNSSNMSEDKSQQSGSCFDIDSTIKDNNMTDVNTTNKLDPKEILTSSNINDDQSKKETVGVNSETNPT